MPVPPPPPPPRGRVHTLAAAALLLVYLAVMSGHMASMDGLLIQRQAQALVFERSIRFQTPVRAWLGEPYWNSKYGLGLSLLYVPGMAFASPLLPMVPFSEEIPSKPATYYYRQLYEDPLYTVGCSWVHAVIAAFTAWLVAGLVVELGGSRRAALWGLAFYGIGSPMLAYSRGDFAQPLAGLCWTAALLAAVRFRHSASTTALWAAAAAVGYAILARPFEGLMLLPAVLALVLPQRLSSWNPRALVPALVVSSGAAAATAVTGLVNWARAGNAAEFGYKLEHAWSIPGFERLSSVLVGPARGILWEFPAIVLVPTGAVALWRRGKTREALALLLLSAALFANTSMWKVWWGGWCWGLRLFLPAIPLLAVVAGAGVDRLASRTRRWLPGLALLAGFAWVLPCVIVDMFEGYAKAADASPTAWTLATYPPYGAWPFLKRLFVTDPIDTDGVDILWFRIAHATDYWSLLVPVVLLALAAVLVVRCRRELLAEETERPTTSAGPPPTTPAGPPPSRKGRRKPARRVAT